VRFVRISYDHFVFHNFLLKKSEGQADKSDLDRHAYENYPRMKGGFPAWSMTAPGVENHGKPGLK
jgi:hypothetical protein